MKKLIYSMLFSVVAAISISACTEQDVKPATDIDVQKNSLTVKQETAGASSSTGTKP